MKKLMLALAFAVVLSPLSSARADLIVYPTFEQAWAVCVDGHVSANYVSENGHFVQNGWVCIPGSGS